MGFSRFHYSHVPLNLLQHTGQDFETKVFFVSESIGPSLDHTNLIVQSFHKTQRHFVLWMTIGGNPIPVSLHHLGKLNIRLKLLPFQRSLPIVEELSGPSFGVVTPQLPKGLPQQISRLKSFVGLHQLF